MHAARAMAYERDRPSTSLLLALYSYCRSILKKDCYYLSSEICKVPFKNVFTLRVAFHHVTCPGSLESAREHMRGKSDHARKPSLYFFFYSCQIFKLDCKV